MFGISKNLLYSFIFISLFFYFVPQIDLWFSGLFFHEQDGFYLSQTLWARFGYELIPVLTVSVTLLLIGSIVITVIRKKTLFTFSTKSYLYMLLTLIIGPGLIVNSTLKDNWNRSRPVSIIEFGGTNTFTPAFVINDDCTQGSCTSFSSGHPTTFFAFLSLSMLLTGRIRKQVISFSVIGGALIGFVRIVQGGHFLSDVVVSGIVVTTVAYSLFWLMFPDKRSNSTS